MRASCGMRVLAAMSGGVDSAVAAARAADAGHDVTGVHLALARNPQTYRTGARGCCTLEDSRDARRAADVIGIPFYVWDMAEQFHDERGGRLRRRVRGRPHPQPVPALQREDQVRRRAGPGGRAGLRRGGHRPPRPARAGRPAAAQRRPGQGPVVRAGRADPRAAGPCRCSRSATRPRRRSARRRPQRGLAVADKPDSHDICFIADGDTRGFLARRLGAAPGDIVDGRDRRRCSAGTPARTATRSASARASTCECPAPDGRPRYVLSITPDDQHRDRRPARRTGGRHGHREPADLARHAHAAVGATCSCARTARSCRRRGRPSTATG